MKTKLLDSKSSADLRLAAALLANGGCVAFPTETVYGLGVDATNREAVLKSFHAKGRPSDNPLIVHLYDVAIAHHVASHVPPIADELWRRFSPGPLTVVLPKADKITNEVTAGLKTVAIRFPNHPVARELLRLCNLPIAAPSANRSGRPSATTWEAVFEDLDGRIDAILCDEPCELGIESTVLDLTVDPPIILRSGSIAIEQLREIIPGVKLLESPSTRFNQPSTQLNQLDGTQEPNSPGLRHRHYQPRAKVNLCKRPADVDVSNAAWIGLILSEGCINTDEYQVKLQLESVEDYAAQLFQFFRRCDRAGILRIDCQIVPNVGVGRALMDRLTRASAD